MKAERLFRIIGLVDEDLIEEAEQPPLRRSVPWRRWATTAACAAVILLGGFYFTVLSSFQGCGASAPAGGGNAAPAEGESGDSEASISGGSPMEGQEDGSSAFLSYAGPVLPLTLAADTPGLEAERTLTWDLTPSDGAARPWGAAVTDDYTLFNTADRELTASALYPFIGSFWDLSQTLPALAVNGQTAETRLYAGEGQTRADTWTDYAALLEDRDYQDRAMASASELEQPVTLYAFTDLQAPENSGAAPTLAITLISGQDTAVLSAGFNGFSWEMETGWSQYSVFLPDGQSGREASSVYLLVLGEDLEGYTAQGYQDGSCSPGKELDTVKFSVSRRETTLSQALKQVLPTLLPTEMSDQWNSEGEMQALFFQTLEKRLAREGPLCRDIARQLGGSLDELTSSLLSQSRIFYLAADVTVPAGGSTSVSASLRKEPSFDFYGAGPQENQGVQGYDLLTQGSVLSFRAATAAMVNGGRMKLVRQNFGFQPEKETGALALDPAVPHYYLELRPLE